MQRAMALRVIRRMQMLALQQQEQQEPDQESGLLPGEQQEPLLRQDQLRRLQQAEAQEAARQHALGAARHWRDKVNVRREAKGLERLPSIMAPPPRLDLLSGLSALGSDLHGCWLLLTSSWLNLLLLAAPLGLASHLAGWGASPTFALNFLALLPLALLLGNVTEELALRCGQLLGGLINATFGNVVEVILSLAALHQGLLDVVAASLLGSILSNLLLVLGCCFLLGGARYEVQSFNQLATRASSSLLFLSCIGIILPTAAERLADMGGGHSLPQDSVLLISRITAVGLLAIYLCYLNFQLVTHKRMFTDDGSTTTTTHGTNAGPAAQPSASSSPPPSRGPSSPPPDEPLLSWPAALLALAAITLVVAAASEFLTASLEEVSSSWGVSRVFLGIIVLPIAGNACEHITAVIVAAKNKMDLAMGVAVGSSIQIALLAVPLAVLAGWAMGKPFSLSFDPFGTLALTVAVVHANFVMGDATSNWLLGVQLLGTYVLIATVYAFR